VIPRLLGALVGEEFLRRKSEEIDEEYRRLESQIPEAVLSSLQSRFPELDLKDIVAQHSDLIAAAEQELRAHYAAAKQRKKSTILHLMPDSRCRTA
jgi:hypothetical protein